MFAPPRFFPRTIEPIIMISELSLIVNIKKGIYFEAKS
jgi:hypothetical protein